MPSPTQTAALITALRTSLTTAHPDWGATNLQPAASSTAPASCTWTFAPPTS